MAPRFRVIDTGLRGARANIAFDQALIEARAAGTIPDTIRFLRFRPSALVGIHQLLGHEVRLDYCRRHGIEVARRITGGGGLYLDQGQLGWELVFDRRAIAANGLADLTRRICEAAALGLRGLGIDAQYRPRNDIEVDGRKISGTGGIVDGDTLFFQGTLLVDFDVERMIAALKVPVEKLAKRDLESARHRVVSLRELLGDALPDLDAIRDALLAGFAEGLGIEPAWGTIGDEEEQLAARLHDDEIGGDDFVRMDDAPEAGDGLVTASLTRPGGTLRADIRLDGPRLERIREVLLSGDVFVSPARTVLDLEAALRGLAVGEAGAAAARFLADRRADLMGLAAEDFGAVIDAALRQLSIPVDGYRLRGHLIGPPPGAAPTLVFLHDALGCARLWRDIPHRLVEATGCGALVYDRRGAGDSDPLSPPFSRTYIAEEALQVLPQVLRAAGIEDAILVGHSDGGTIALAFAGAYPRMVRGVIAESAHLFREAKTLGTIRGHIEDFEHGDLKQRLARHHGAKTDMLFRRLVETWTAAGDGGWGVEEWLAQIRCPVLAIHGDDDEFFTDAQPRAIGAAVAGPLRLVRLANCGHVPHHQAREPALEAMRGFILELRRDASA